MYCYRIKLFAKAIIKQGDYMEKRSKFMFKAFIVIFSFLLLTILKIIVFDKASYTTAATNQHLEKESVKIYRGMIYDKNLIPFVDCRSYILNHKDKIRYNITKRYDDRSLARHIIGYVNSENDGMSGIEKTYNDILKTTGSFDICNINDVHSFEVSYLPKTLKNSDCLSNGIKLTLDYHIQKIVENTFDKKKSTGAAVVIDVENFDILAIASKPDFDQNNIEKYINQDGTELVNRAISEYNAGSIFKIITTAAAIEHNIANADDLFYCEGFKKIGSNIFNCNKKEGHQSLTFKDAFAKSCNVCFYDLALLMGKEKLYDTAKKFSLGKRLINLEGEATGSIEMGDFDADMANSAIGQGKILITPIQAANMAAIIANDGKQKSINLASSIVDKSGYDIKNIKYQSEKRVISQTCANIIKDMMKLTVDDGTGILAFDNSVNICGKTGSAETGWKKDGNLMVHGWFVGFFPYDNPKYAMSIFLENGQSGSVAAQMFLDIAKQIQNYGK